MPSAVSVNPVLRPMVRSIVLAIETQEPFEVVDLTARLSHVVEESELVEGLLSVQTRHTTTGLLINEHEPLLLTDLEAMFDRLVPSSMPYAHDDYSRRTANLTERERRNGHAHCRAALLRTSESVAVTGGRLALGRWQRIFLVEFDGGQRREIALTLLGTGGALSDSS